MQLATTLIILTSLFQPCHLASTPPPAVKDVQRQSDTPLVVRAAILPPPIRPPPNRPPPDGIIEEEPQPPRGPGPRNVAVPVRALGKGAVVMAVVMTVVVVV